MDFKRLAEIVRSFGDIEFLAAEIKALEGSDIESIDDLSEALEDELGCAGNYTD